MTKNVVITGACGFLGVNAVLAFARCGYRVWAADIVPPGPDLGRAWDEVQGAIEFVPLDVTNPRDWERLPSQEVGAVIHTAAVTSGDRDDRPSLTVKVNVQGTMQALDWTDQSQIPRFIYISSSSVYRGIETEEPLNEALCLAPTTVYGRSKWAAEGFCELYAHKMGLPVSIVRLPSLYGPWERPGSYRLQLSPVYEMIQRGFERDVVRVGRVGNGQRDYTSAEDVGAVLVRLAGMREAPLRMNLSTGRMVAPEELCQQLASLMDARFELVDDAGADVLLTPTSGNQPMDTSRMQAAGLSMGPSLRENLARTVQWFSHHYPMHHAQ